MINTMTILNIDNIYIREYPECFSHAFCQELMEFRKALKVEPFEDLVFWKHKDLNQEISHIRSLIENELKVCIDNYFSSFSKDLNYEDLEYLGHGLIRQESGVYDVQHFDTPVVVNNDDIYLRPFVCLIYLNGEELQGGQLVFPAQKKVITPTTGKVILFPCSYLFPHFVTTLAAGERFFIRINYKFKSKNLIDADLDKWDVSKDGIQHQNK